MDVWLLRTNPFHMSTAVPTCTSTSTNHTVHQAPLAWITLCWEFTTTESWILSSTVMWVLGENSWSEAEFWVQQWWECTTTRVLSSQFSCDVGFWVPLRAESEFSFKKNSQALSLPSEFSWDEWIQQPEVEWDNDPLRRQNSFEASRFQQPVEDKQIQKLSNSWQSELMRWLHVSCDTTGNMQRNLNAWRFLQGPLFSTNSQTHTQPKEKISVISQTNVTRLDGTRPAADFLSLQSQGF